MNVCCVTGIVNDSVFSRLVVLKYVLCLYKGCCVFCLNCDAKSCRCSCI